MQHVFVETNWIVDFVAPPHLVRPEAARLAARAADGEVQLHIPSVCFSEAGPRMNERITEARKVADYLREYIRVEVGKGQLAADHASMMRRILDQLEQSIISHRDAASGLLAGLTSATGVEVFALSERMLEMTLRPELFGLGLKPFDLGILAAVLVRAEEIRHQGDTELSFCTLDKDLQPWHRESGARKENLARLYDDAGVWVYGDFSLTSPARPAHGM